MDIVDKSLLNELNNTLEKSYPGLIERIKHSKEIMCMGVIGSYSRKCAHVGSDVDLLFITDSLNIKGIHGLHCIKKGIRLDLILVDKLTLLEQKLSKYIIHSIFLDFKILYCKSNALRKTIELVKNKASNCPLQIEERENFWFHMRWILEKLRLLNEEDYVLSGVLKAKFLYFLTLLSSRWQNKPLSGEAQGIKIIQSSNPPAYKIIRDIMKIFNEVPLGKLEELLSLLSEKANFHDGELLVEVVELVTPVNYSTVSIDIYKNVKKWGKKIILGQSED